MQLEAWNVLRGYVYRACGVVLESHQCYLMAQRLEPVAHELGLASVDDLVRAACVPSAPPRFAQAIVDAMTTHETSFFRDPPFWATLERHVLPALFAKSGPRPLRIWSAACSTGQEAYSLAMLIAERWPGIVEGTQIVATDVSEAVLARARGAAYGVSEANRGLSAARLVNHFEEAPGGFRIRARLRERMVFLGHNLIGKTPYPAGFDLVLARNVLIYFADADRAAVMARLVRSLGPGGFIGLGSSEILPGVRPLGAGWYAPGSIAPSPSSSCAKCRINVQICPEHAGR